MPLSEGPQRRGTLDDLPWSSPQGAGRGVLRLIGRLPRLVLRLPILAYRYTLSSFMGRQCRYLPTCSEYADEAISRHGAWPGLFMATARLCRCHPWGGHGYDPVPPTLPVEGRWYRPWRYGRWHFKAERVDKG
ncbi:membrane protein insertion efficiency factor YidD [Xanthobacter variabilis]|uniref:membrane protein insertion efficiency factor YidD n=1 Tax=Xanthobacter variabilis TaxID=3119932 RepID=UPI00372D297D